MTAHELIYDFGTVCAMTGAILAWIFVGVYSRRRWHEYEIGQNAMMFTVIIALSLSWSTYRALEIVVDPNMIQMRDLVARALIFFGITLALSHRLNVLRKVGRVSGKKPPYFAEHLKKEEEEDKHER